MNVDTNFRNTNPGFCVNLFFSTAMTRYNFNNTEIIFLSHRRKPQFGSPGLTYQFHNL